MNFDKEYLEITEEIKKNNLGYSFRKSKNHQLLHKLNLPEVILDFYKNFEPVQEKDWGPVSLHDIEGILSEAEHYFPGYQTTKHGLIVFASTGAGQGICFNTQGKENPDIYFISSQEDYAEMNLEEILDLCPNQKICDNFLEFLKLFAADDAEKIDMDLA